MSFVALFLLPLLLLQNPPSPQTPAATAATEKEPPKATLKGHVYALDTGAPLKRAQLSLRPTTRPMDAQSATTDAQGAFEFKNVEAGSYNLSASKTGFVPITYGQKDPMRPPTPITVRAGQEIKDLDFRLMRGGVIAGTVVDEDGEPMSNVMVAAMARQYIRGKAQMLPRNQANTDDRGQYRIFNLPPGRYYIQASQRATFMGGDQDLGYAPIFYPNALSLQDAQRVEVTNGAEVRAIDLLLRPVPTHSVSGKIIDSATGKTVTEGFIQAMSEDFTRGLGGAGGAVKSDGTFRLTGMLPGRYRLMVVSTGQGGLSAMRPFVKTFDMGEANVTGLVITMGPGVPIKGKVVAEGGTVPENLRLTLMPKGEGLMSMAFGFSNVQVQKDLSFEVQNVQPGEYVVNASQGSFNPLNPAGAAFFVSEARQGGENVLERGITVAEGAPVADLEVVLDFRAGTVTGRATDEKGEPVSGAAVVLVSADSKKRATDRFFRSSAADQNGNFKVTGVIPGDYLALLWPGPDAFQLMDPDIFTQVEKHAVRVSVDKAGTANQDLKIISEVKTAAQNTGQ